MGAHLDRRRQEALFLALSQSTWVELNYYTAPANVANVPSCFVGSVQLLCTTVALRHAGSAA